MWRKFGIPRDEAHSAIRHNFCMKFSDLRVKSGDPLLFMLWMRTTDTGFELVGTDGDDLLMSALFDAHDAIESRAEHVDRRFGVVVGDPVATETWEQTGKLPEELR